MSEWISVKDRLPRELHQQVLVVDAKGTMAIGVLVDKESLYFDSYCNYDITHWMPLPEPPQNYFKE